MNKPRPWAKKRVAHERRTNPNAALYSSTAWRKLSRAYRNAHPLCEQCKSEGRTTAAQVADHKKPVNKGGAPLEWGNLRSLCHKCHNSKSGTEAHDKGRGDANP